MGPYSVIGPRVRVGPGSVVMGHAFIDKDTEIGTGCRIFPFASLGADPQDLKYAGERSRLVLGDRVVVREGATIHRGTEAGGGLTSVADDCLVMATVHVAHDCRIGEGAILSSFAVLAGHVKIGRKAIVSGSTAIHQFVRVGAHAMVGGMSGPSKDVPPFMLMVGVRDKDASITPNLVGLRRNNFPPEAVEAITGAWRALHNHRPLAEALGEVEAAWPGVEEVAHLVRFYRESERGVYR